jgi:hypothetical protein
MRVLLILLWIVTIVSTCLGGITLIEALNAEAAPGQGAAAALACGFAVIPYVFTRAVEGMAGKQRTG